MRSSRDVGRFFICLLLVCGSFTRSSARRRRNTLVHDNEVENRAVNSINGLRENSLDRHEDYYYQKNQKSKPIDELNEEKVVEEEDNQKRLSSYLEELTRRTKFDDDDGDNSSALLVDGQRIGRRLRKKKLSSLEQGAILVQALGNRQRNKTVNGLDDHRGFHHHHHNSNRPQSTELQNEIMDLLGRSTCALLLFFFFSSSSSFFFFIILVILCSRSKLQSVILREERDR